MPAKVNRMKMRREKTSEFPIITFCPNTISAIFESSNHSFEYLRKLFCSANQPTIWFSPHRNIQEFFYLHFSFQIRWAFSSGSLGVAENAPNYSIISTQFYFEQRLLFESSNRACFIRVLNSNAYVCIVRLMCDGNCCRQERSVR